ncbi:uncharacterized protein ARMOST_09753 [Armillaria ostoyae]|uniref:DRBM domain-containing protein n=1 Tax=Armillaria ostoyae TaxID=47428 RepID=A0A284RCC1_ARMOS|nr:uncharacterized protein ARMOST_09753 [Armillaria ostoyae]
MPSNRGTVELNNYLQSKGMLASLSWIESISGPRYGPTWTCICKIDGQVRGIAMASFHRAVVNKRYKYLMFTFLSLSYPHKASRSRFGRSLEHN